MWVVEQLGGKKRRLGGGVWNPPHPPPPKFPKHLVLLYRIAGIFGGDKILAYFGDF
jgi:hypothetical protein